jgi:predicted nucleotidyltransferase
MGIPEIVADKKEQIPALVAKYGAFNVHVFGSVANGTADDIQEAIANIRKCS